MNNNTVESYNRIYKDEPDRWDIHIKLNEERSLIKYIKENYNKDIKIVDLGCGCGRTIFYLNQSGFNPIGVDFSFEAIELAKKLNPNTIFKKEDITHTEFKDKEFDLVLSMGTHEHLSQITFKECHRILKDDGLFCCLLPTQYGDKGWHISSPQSEWLYSVKTWTEYLKKDGFNVIDNIGITYAVLLCEKDD